MAYDPYGCSLYVGNLDPRVCTELLEEIFCLAGQVKLCKVVGDKNSGQSLGFGFVDFEDRQTAASALEKFNGRTVYGQEIRVDWAHTGTGAAGKFINPNQEDISGHYCLFIGNLSPDVDDQMLFDAFSASSESCSSAKVSRDPDTQRASGYGFVSFRERKDAEQAIERLNGQTVGQRQIRVDWARTKTNAATRAAAMGLPEPRDGEGGREPLDYEAILRQADRNNITVYVAGLPTNTDEQELMEIMRDFGLIDDLRIPESSRSNADNKAYAFVKYRTHEEAARAIHGCQSKEFKGRPMSVTWGRENQRRRDQQRFYNHGPPGHYPMRGPGYPGQPFQQQQPGGGFQPHGAYPPFPQGGGPPPRGAPSYGMSGSAGGGQQQY